MRQNERAPLNPSARTALLRTPTPPPPQQQTMSYLLPHLRTGWAVDQAILNEEDRVVVVRFGHDYDPVCMQMDEASARRPVVRRRFHFIVMSRLRE